MNQPDENKESQNSEQQTPIGRIEPKKIPVDSAELQAGLAKALGQARGLPSEDDSESVKSGLKGFIGSIFKSSDNEQKPDQGFFENLSKQREEAKQAGGQQKAPGLFHAMDAPLRGLTSDDLRFANEVDAALSRRPKYGARLLSLSVAFLLFMLIIWAALSDIDEVTHAEGQVVGSQRTQTIQNLEGGIVRSIQVREGQTVEKGAILAYLDNEMAESSFRDAVSKAMENHLALVRLEAELRGQEPVFPEDLRRWMAARLGMDIDSKTLARAQQMLNDQKNTWQSRAKLLKSDLDVLQAQYKQRQHDVEEQESRQKQLKQSLALAIDQRNTGADLLRRKNFARMEYLNLEQKVVELQGQLDGLNASIPRAKAAEAEALQRIASREATEKTDITQEIAKRRLELNSLRETLSAGADRVTRTEIRAPVRGTIKQVYINTLGGVVKPGEPIMDLVPLDDTLLVEARVSPKDVAFLHPGQKVMVKVSAYDFSIYGGLEGKLESISADTIEDRKGDFHYLAKVRTPQTAIVHNNETLPIIPGMMVTADILIGKKTVLDYLLKPILRAQQNALRER